MINQELEKLEETSRLRVLLESHAVEEIARRPDRLDEVRTRMSPFIPRFKALVAQRDYAGFTKADYLLHRTLIELACNPLLLTLWERVWSDHALAHRDHLETYWPDMRVLADEHVYLIQTVCSGDATATLDALRSHLEGLLFRVKNTHATPGDRAVLERVCAYLSCHMHHRLSLEQIAREVAFVSPGHLSRLFRQRYGIGFQAYTHQLRMEKAATLLGHSHLPIRAVARRCGYASASRFTEHFKRFSGHTPSTYQSINMRGRSAPLHSHA